MPMRGEISTLPLSKAGRQTTGSAWSSIYALSEDPDFLAVAAFSTIGLLISLCLAMQFPDTSVMVALLAQF